MVMPIEIFLKVFELYIYIYKKYLFHTSKVLKKLVSDIINTVLEKCKAHKPV